MATCSNILLLIMAVLIILGEMQFGSAQNCGCPKDTCCSQYGYCGSTDDYCGIGCQQGPCHIAPSPSQLIEPIESIITPDFFNYTMSASCKGNNLYNYDGFISAAKSPLLSGFGTTGSLKVRKRELAAFFANFVYETGINGCNAGEDVEGPNVAFVSSLTFWMMGSNCHHAMTSSGKGNGFGRTIREINGRECDGGRPSAVQERVSLYTKFCKELDVASGPNLTC